MFYVYILRSIQNPIKTYTGFTFTEGPKAIAFEKYLKSGSGRAFAKKHF